MDIWAWVWDMQDTLREQGHDSLATYIMKLPHDTVEGNHQEIEQYIDNIVAEARQAGFSWVELFFRHWYLQSKVLHRGEPKDALKEAVSLLEFAHTEENRDCPQSVCVVQDLASCYGQLDGAGYSDQRIAVAREGLDKINPDWPCYKCIAAEYAEALRDAKRYDECIEFLKQIDNDYIQNGDETDTSNLLLVKVCALMRLGKYEEARKQGKKLLSWGGGSNFELDAITLRALIEAHDKQIEEAMKLLPELDSILRQDSSLIDWWIETMVLAIKANTSQYDENMIETLLSLADTLEQRGTYRQAFDAYTQIIELKPLFPNTMDSHEILTRMQQIKDKLHQDFGATETLKQLQTRFNTE